MCLVREATAGYPVYNDIIQHLPGLGEQASKAAGQELGSSKAKLHHSPAFPLSPSQEACLLFLYAEILRIASSPNTKVHTISKTQLVALNSLYILHLLEPSVVDTSKTSKSDLSNS